MEWMAGDQNIVPKQLDLFEPCQLGTAMILHHMNEIVYQLEVEPKVTKKSQRIKTTLSERGE
jgi:hypothetical protein